MKAGDIVYEACYNSCYHESVNGTLSIHITEEGANIAMQKHKKEKKKEWMDLYKTEEDRKAFPFAKNELWSVVKTVLQD